MTEEEERRARNANMKREAVEGPLLRFISRGEKVKVPMIVEVEVPAPSAGYKRPYVPGPLPNLSRPPSNPLSNTSYYSPFGNNAYTRPAPTSANALATKDNQAARNAYSPYYYPLPAPPSRTGISTTTAASTNTLSLNSGVHSGKLVTHSRNYVVLETPGATPSEDYQYLFGDHVDWASLKVLPKNRPSGMLSLLIPYSLSS